VRRDILSGFRGPRARDQGAHRRPWTPASLFSCSSEGNENRDRSLSQNQPRRFHLNSEPRQIVLFNASSRSSSYSGIGVHNQCQ
jgi:hypothetical protein